MHTTFHVTKPQLNPSFVPIKRLAVIEVAGIDSVRFLQGQLTCNIAEMSPDRASFAGFCNAKGRVISCLIVIKRRDDFLLVLPSSLLPKVISGLRRYVLRAQVSLRDPSPEWLLLGITGPLPWAGIDLAEQSLSAAHSPFTILRLASSPNRYICLIESKNADEVIDTMLRQGLSQQTDDYWRHLDIGAGIPWFESPQSELYIPQMLNLDKLGGISFNKGCYTGQEIVARTHYLGQNKRELYLAEADCELTDDCLEAGILNAESEEKIGTVLNKQNFAGRSQLLLILQTVDESTKNLILGDANRTVLKLLPSQ